jgi:hypothetical protein
MKTTSKTIDSAARVVDQGHARDHPSHGYHHDHDDHDQDDHDHGTWTAEYLRLGLLGIIVVASLTGGVRILSPWGARRSLRSLSPRNLALTLSSG